MFQCNNNFVPIHRSYHVLPSFQIYCCGLCLRSACDCNPGNWPGPATLKTTWFFVRGGAGVNSTGQELTSPGSDSPVKITPTDAAGLAAIGFVINSDWTVVVESMSLMRGTFINGSGPGTTHWDGEAERTLFQINWYPGDSLFLIGGAGMAKYDVRAIRDVSNWFDTVQGVYAGETVFSAAGVGFQISRSQKFATQVRALAFYYPETDMGAQTMAASTGYSVMLTVDWFPF